MTLEKPITDTLLMIERMKCLLGVHSWEYFFIPAAQHGLKGLYAKKCSCCGEMKRSSSAEYFTHRTPRNEIFNLKNKLHEQNTTEGCYQ